MTGQEIKDSIFSVNDQNFEHLALEIYTFQYQNNPIYRSFNDLMHLNPDKVKKLTEIPFLPIGLYKNKKVLISKHQEPMGYFESSGTSSQSRSKNYYYDLDVYETSFSNAFRLFFGPPEQYCILGLLPTYTDRPNASLAYMVQHVMGQSKHPDSNFFLSNFQELQSLLRHLDTKKQPTILFGVTFALLDFVSEYQGDFNYLKVIETGGMKGRGEEWSKKQIHDVIRNALGLSQVFSEYGMTELFSQAYALHDGIFNCPPWMKVLLRESNDPLQLLNKGRGAINIIDLANIDTCSFIATDDVGELYENSSFQVLGRLDHAEWRGCSLMYV